MIAVDHVSSSSDTVSTSHPSVPVQVEPIVTVLDPVQAETTTRLDVVREPIQRTQEEQDDLDLVAEHQRHLEDERRKERERLVPGMSNDDLNALLRTFDKVSESSQKSDTSADADNASASPDSPNMPSRL